MSDAESHDIKILIGFPGNPILEILITNRNCEGRTNMRRFSHESSPYCYLYLSGDFEILFDVDLFDFE